MQIINKFFSHLSQKLNCPVDNFIFFKKSSRGFFNFALSLFLVFALTSCADLNLNLKQRKKTPPVKKPKEVVIESKPAPRAVPTQPIVKETQPTTSKKYQLGIIVPLSGKNKELGQSLLNAATMALFDNDKNNEVELVVFDSKSSPKDALQAVNDAAKRNIKVVLGPVYSTEVEAISDEIKDNKMVALSFSNNQDLRDRKGVFLMGFLPEQQIEKIVDYSISMNRNNFGIIAPNNPYGLKMADLLREVARRKDGNFVASEYYQIGSKANIDLEKATQRLLKSFTVSNRVIEKGSKKRSNDALREEDKIYADVIMVPEAGENLSKIVKLIKKYNTQEKDIQIIGTSSWDDISTLNDSELIGGWFAAPDFLKYKEFERKYYRIYDKFPYRISSIAYDGVLAVLELIKSGEAGPNLGDINKRLTAQNFVNYNGEKNAFSGIDGLFRFLPNGLLQRNLAVLEVGDGKFEVLDSPSTMFLKY